MVLLSLIIFFVILPLRCAPVRIATAASLVPAIAVLLLEKLEILVTVFVYTEDGGGAVADLVLKVLGCFWRYF